MKITFLLTQSLDSPGGGGRYLPLAKALVRAGHEVTMLALHHDYAQTAQHRFSLDGVAVEYVGQMHVRKVGDTKFYYSAPKMVWISLLATLRLARAAFRIPADVLHVCKTQPMNALAAFAVHTLRGTPVYLDCDDYEALNNRFGGRWQQTLTARIEDWMPSFASGITTSNTFLAERFTGLGYPAGRIRIVPHGIDPAKFEILNAPDLEQTLAGLRQSLQIRPGQPVVVFVGTLSLINHAIELLIQAFPAVLAAFPEAVLLIVGGGEDLETLRGMAAEQGISAAVRFAGKIPRDQVPYYYRLGTVSVDPKRDTVLANSSLSVKLLESIAARVPLVTADTGDSRRILDGAGLAVKPGDTAALAEGILTILKDPALAEKMRQAAVQVGKQYTWDQLASDFLTIYQLS